MRSELARMRELLRAALPEKAFIRRDRGDALYTSNAPAFQPEIPAIPGFILQRNHALLHILPDKTWMLELEKQDPPDQLSETLIRFRGAEPDEAALILFARGLKLLDGGAAPHEAAAFDRAVRQRAAAALRGENPGGLYALSLLNHQIQKENEI